MHNTDNTKPPHLTLSPADAAAVDAVVDAAPILDSLLRAEQSKDTPSIDPVRIQRVHSLAAAIRAACADAPAAESPASQILLKKTLAAIDADRAVQRMKIANAPSPKSPADSDAPSPYSFWHRRWRKVAAGLVAASILVAVVIPMLTTARQSSLRVACANNLSRVSSAFGQYAANFTGQLPSIPLPADNNWMPQGPGYRPAVASADSHSNTANLLPLVNASYMPASRLACPARTDENSPVDLSKGDIPDSVRGYSYTNLYAADRPKWDGQRQTLVMADRNPLFGSKVVDDVNANSFNHNHRGNYVLRGDGTVTWETSPNIGSAGDNIWTIGPEKTRVYRGTETVQNASDTFLSP